MTKIFEIKEKPGFWVIFEHTFFLKNPVKFNYSSSPGKRQIHTVDWPSNQKLFHHYLHAKIIRSIYSIYQIICEIHLI